MRIILNNFDLQQVAESGQCFRWRKLYIGQNVKGYSIPAFGQTLIAIQRGREFQFSCDENEWELLWNDYFDMDRCYGDIGRSIMSGDDEHLKTAYEYGSGIRILKQDVWETIISFMISQNNNIPRISKTIELLCDRCNQKSLDGTENIARFPGVREIPLEIFDDPKMGFGYRGEYLKEMCQYVKENPMYLTRLRQMSYEEAMKSLLTHKGIGAKVANCICLFGLGHVEAFPVDTHVKKLVEKHYNGNFEAEKYNGYAGIVQQYLFYYDLKNGEK